MKKCSEVFRNVDLMWYKSKHFRTEVSVLYHVKVFRYPARRLRNPPIENRGGTTEEQDTKKQEQKTRCAAPHICASRQQFCSQL